ncbi:protocatechuate 4,5-dioxygenase subunit alpha [Mesobacterium sp. TK19101]|uniref:Protocatechuate 4,5-dioxygenase subunit alpha n=1 Tax=Mesobacterium hydrothermale TaxID=3111907 RepID=A0ABU6HFZ9_9RHOB|nr:protocatechuate 4,5-dioxygenase subunit alpha [Mesobacterium sp. TK19101]MEC3861221.1 protocatechuate 4,5-dioxygenase subunit alpha [Mesobacterium sp. TK19101]
MHDLPGYDYHLDIPGTTIFDGKQAMKGYALNKMCYDFNKAVNREAFKADPEAWMEKYGLNEEQKQAIRNSDILGMIAAGGNIYYLAKLAGIFKLSVQDVGGLQTGRTTEEFKEFLKSQA